MYIYILVDLPCPSTNIVWAVLKGVTLPHRTLLNGSKSLKHISQFSLDHFLLYAKETMPKYPTAFLEASCHRFC